MSIFPREKTGEYIQYFRPAAASAWMRSAGSSRNRASASNFSPPTDSLIRGFFCTFFYEVRIWFVVHGNKVFIGTANVEHQWIKEKHGWKLVAFQSTQVPEPAH